MLLDERKIRDHFSGSPVLDFRSFLRESVFYAIGKFVDKFVFFISWKKKKIPVYYKDMN